MVEGLIDDTNVNIDDMDFEDDFDQMVWEVANHDGDDELHAFLSLMIDLKEVEGLPPNSGTPENTNMTRAQRQQQYYIHQTYDLTILIQTLAQEDRNGVLTMTLTLQ